MKTIISLFRNSSSLGFALITGALFFSLGCGGGTTGTGNATSTTVLGRLTAQGDGPLSQVTVTVVDAKEMAAAVGGTIQSGTITNNKTAATQKILAADTTDAQGNFTLSLDLHPQQITFQFQRSDIDSTYVLSNIPAAAVKVSLDLEYKRETQEIAEGSHHYEDESGNEVFETPDGD